MNINEQEINNNNCARFLFEPNINTHNDMVTDIPLDTAIADSILNILLMDDVISSGILTSDPYFSLTYLARNNNIIRITPNKLPSLSEHPGLPHP